jgi:L-threonine kinase
MDTSNSKTKVTHASIPCTCGELFQGALDGEPCLVSCPIDILSTANIIVDTAPYPQKSRGKKVERALDWIFKRTGHKFEVEIKNPLPTGRGYGTSTADIGATLFAASRTANFELTACEASQIAVQIEPTDSILFSGLSLFAHRTGQFYTYLGATPAAQLIILDPGGIVDSETFNARDWSKPLYKLAHDQQKAFQVLQQGVASADLQAIGEASTLSAIYHQTILFNPLIDIALSLTKQLGAAGICRAHSGTIVGLIFQKDCAVDEIMKCLSHKLPSAIQIRSASLVGGGVVCHDDPESETIFDEC